MIVVARQLLAVAALAAAGVSGLAACSSTSGGAPTAPASVAVSLPAVSASVPSVSVPSNLPSNLPSSVASSLASLISGGPSVSPGSQFCKLLANGPGNIAQLGNHNAAHKYLSYYDKLQAAAPASLQPDAKLINEYLHSLLNGGAGKVNAKKLEHAFIALGQAGRKCQNH